MAKPKRPKAVPPDDSGKDTLEDMPIARAIQRSDAAALTSAITSALVGNDATVSDVTIDKSVGGAFTGGRSTPVYYVTCMVRRPGMKDPRRRNFVAKLIVMEGGETDPRVMRMRESYAVERRFYGTAASRIRNGAAKLAIPRLLGSDRDGSRPWPAVCFLMNDLRYHGYPRHPDFLSREDAARALRWLAAFHSSFFGDGPSEAWRRDLWDRGGFWTGGKDGEGGGVASQWSQTVRWLQNSYPQLVTPATKGMGQRIQAAAKKVANFLSKESKGPRGTLIHGDYKAANLFFVDVKDKYNSPDDESTGAETVAAVDFQFSGAGLGAEDVAYLLFPDARGHYFDHEDTLLKVYHEELVSSLIEQRKGGPSSLTFASFRGYYGLSQLDFARHLLGRGWVGSTEGDARLVSSLEATLLRVDGGSALVNEDVYVERMAQMVSG